MSGSVIAAVDLGPSTSRVLLHAAGMARLLSVPLRILHVTGSPTPDETQRVAQFCAQYGPYEVDTDNVDVAVRTGVVSAAIYREAEHHQARMVVIGSRGHGRVSRLLLGSTSMAVLKDPPAPVLLVPPVDMDIMSLADRPRLSCGRVVAAVDLAEDCSRQLAMASTMAKLAGQPLVLLTVPPSRISDAQASAMLRERGHGLEPVRPHAMIVRRGRVADEIARCALEEQSGLVVMGLRSARRGQPGAIASAVLGKKRTFVLAVPEQG